MVNKREFFRLEMEVPFSFSVVRAKDEHVPTSQTFHYRTQDLSGGGLRFETHLHLQEGDLLCLELLLPEKRPVEMLACVVWSKQVTVDGQVIYVGGLEFREIDEEEQDRIVGFLFRAQIEARKKRQRQRKQFEGKG